MERTGRASEDQGTVTPEHWVHLQLLRDGKLIYEWGRRARNEQTIRNYCHALEQLSCESAYLLRPGKVYFKGPYALKCFHSYLDELPSFGPVDSQGAMADLLARPQLVPFLLISV